MSLDESSYADELKVVEDLVGHLRGEQRFEVIDALDENHDGVLALAKRIAEDSGVHNRIAVFITAIRSGDHKYEQKPAAGEGMLKIKTLRLSPREAFRRYFDEYREWQLDVFTEDENLANDRALDYAVDSLGLPGALLEGHLQVRLTPYAKGETPLTLEDELRAELGIARPVTRGEDRTRMMRDYEILKAGLHDDRISGMHQALMDQCAIPGEPTHDEARDARAALIAEIAALGVTPGVSALKVADVEGWTSIGEALGATSRSEEPRPTSRGGLRSAQHAYCRRGSKCQIAVAGHGAALSPLTRQATGGSGLCIPCHEARQNR